MSNNPSPTPIPQPSAAVIRVIDNKDGSISINVELGDVNLGRGVASKAEEFAIALMETRKPGFRAAIEKARQSLEFHKRRSPARN